MAVPVAQSEPDADPYTEFTCGGHAHLHDVQGVKRASRRIWHPRRWERGGDPRTPAQVRRLRHMIRCNEAQRPRLRAIVKRERVEYKQVRRERVRRAKRKLEADWCAPRPHPEGAGCWEIPAWCVHAESGGSWTAHNPSSPARGPYQLLGHGEPWPVDSRADALRHHEIAEGLYRSRGLQPWVAC